MSDKNMIALAEIRNGYALNKYGNLTLEQNSLIKYDNLCLNLIKEIQELKKHLTTYQILHRDCKVDNLKNISKIEEMENQQKEFIEYLENEKDRLVRGCSNVYEDSLGKTRFVNEDIFNEVYTILSKYKEIIGDKNKKYIPGEYATETFIKTIDKNILLKNQQKEFIDWLEENYKNTQDIWYIKILNKYKEIIGDNK